MKKLFVITGAGGTGKTSLINALRGKGLSCVDELARELIEEQLKIKGSLVPWVDLLGFNDVLLDRFISQHNSLSESIHLLDRGIPDIIGYFRASDKEVHEKFFSAARKYRYHKLVFFTEPWKEIYALDSVRREPFEFSEKISKHLKEAYIELNYEVVSIPPVSVEKRAEFVLKKIKEN